MVFETLIATALYTGAITSLHYDGPPTTTAGLENQAQVETTVADQGGSSFSASSSAQNDDIDPADIRGESIWAKGDGKFEEWAK